MKVPKIPKWFIYSCLAALCWGVWGIISKVAVDLVNPFLSQVLLTIGWLPLVGVVATSKQFTTGTNSTRGIGYGFATGIIGGLGNLAFFEALGRGQASTVVPVSALYPLVTLVTAMLILNERLNRIQVAGVGLAVIAILLLSGP